ncbi:hypothetical protein MDUV_28350 [Mycolicibacterium duvalii]|uniref:Oligosaccharide repeat unit polymerase n=1 Tax=Mycolicibacterium duvalii TaxID=39688 RepID=A0A7I7K1P2_9MYCO|nr:hypothetical protein MDUV_28350 [Mycolicibacterium duvalii]
MALRLAPAARTGAAGPVDGDHLAVPPPWWFTPAFFILVPVIASFTAWLLLVGWRSRGSIPASWAKLSGFAIPETPSLAGTLLLVVWYAAVVSVATWGWRVGLEKRPPAATVARLMTASFERRYFALIMITSIIGIAYSYYKIGSAQSIIGSLTTQEDQFTNALPGYAGVQTLRSATILAAPIGFYLWRKKVIAWPFMVFALLLLVLNAAIASRLSLFMAAVVYLVIWVKTRTPSAHTGSAVARRWIAAVVLVGVGMSLLAGLNYVRNALYYKDVGVTNPYVMNLYQMGAYLGVPAQVSIGVADAVMTATWENPGHIVTSSDAARPTFLQFQKVAKSDGLKDAEAYAYSVELESNFTTNSVFADTYAVYGMWGWVYTIGLYAFAGWAFARLFRYGVVVGASAGVMAHCLSEVWRTQNVNFGFVIFLLLLTVASAVAANLWCRRDEARDAEFSSRRSGSSPMPAQR